jgi:hypothetical protein
MPFSSYQHVKGSAKWLNPPGAASFIMLEPEPLQYAYRFFFELPTERELEPHNYAFLEPHNFAFPDPHNFAFLEPDPEPHEIDVTDGTIQSMFQRRDRSRIIIYNLNFALYCTGIAVRHWKRDGTGSFRLPRAG